MQIDWDTPVDVLMHGADIAYIDLDETELMHWKYIKREKRPNGKWRYYYDIKDALGYDEQERLNKASAEYSRATKNAYGFQEYVSRESNRATVYNPKTDKLEYKSESWKKYVSDLHAQKTEKFKAAEEAGKRASKAAADFYRTPLGKLDKAKKSIQRGKKRAAEALRKLADKISK